MTIEDFDRTAHEEFESHWKGYNASGFCWMIELSPYLSDHGFHYEWHNNRTEVHLEGDGWRPIRKLFYDNWKELEDAGLTRQRWWNRKDCLYFLKDSDDIDQLKKLKSIIEPLVERHIEKNGLRPNHIHRPEPSNDLFHQINQKIQKKQEKDPNVIFYNSMKLSELFNNKLMIPSYQRIYCWAKENVNELLNDVIKNDGEYHLGAVILCKTKDGFDIVDGQQRLVTLTLLLEAMGYKGCLPLNEESFGSEDAKKHIAYNKFLCKSFVEKCHSINLHHVLEDLLFSVLVISQDKFELAYTFFSNENSRGKALNDYNLLKAHHLRHVQGEAKQEHLAKRWDKLTQEKEMGKMTDVQYSLGQHILRLRKWMQGEVVPLVKYVVRDEYVAAPILEDVPGFGERFHFNETIQGGAHFFTYAEKMTEQYCNYANTEEHKALIDSLHGESHDRYSELIDSLLFGYYLKFGSQYLAEALYAIEKTVSEHRYNNARANKDKIMEFVTRKHIIMKIDRASSPSFFLAELLQEEECVSRKEGIKLRYHERVKHMYKRLIGRFSIKSIANHVKDMLNNE